MSSKTPKFTVFTATYNRAHTLEKVYKSLVSQTLKDFEWVIVDDGSSDSTKELVQGFIAENLIDIRYVCQENAGKHVAFNHGVQLARGEYFVSLDSDDQCVPDALLILYKSWMDIAESERKLFGSVAGVAIKSDGEISGKLFPCSPLDGWATEIRAKYNITGDKWGFILTEIWKEFPFAVYPGEKFLPEASSLIKINKKYKIRFINTPLLIIDEEDPSRLTHRITKLRAKNPQGTLNYYKAYAYEDMAWREKIKSIINYYRFLIHAGMTFPRFLNSPYFPWSAVFLPVGLAMFLRDKDKEKRD